MHRKSANLVQNVHSLPSPLPHLPDLSAESLAQAGLPAGWLPVSYRILQPLGFFNISIFFVTIRFLTALI